MNIQGTSLYHEVHARSLADPEGFWAEAAKEIDWIEPPKKIFDPGAGVYGRWFTGGVVNTCYNALDRHVDGGRADQVALIHDIAAHRNSVTKFTYAELLDEVRRSPRCCSDSASARATASSSTCRWCPRRWSRCSPARASARCIRSCSAASPRKNSRPASTTPSRS